jgi:glycosyltransferase involved in cell wall biosynthesis
VILTQPEPTLFSSAGNVHQMISPFKNRLLARFWGQLVFPFRLRNYDIVHFIKNLGVFGLKSRKVITIYDLTTLRYPHFFPKVDVLYWRCIQRHTLNQADKIIAISQDTAKDIMVFYGLPQEKIQVIYPAHASYFKPPTQSEIFEVRNKYNLPEKFLVHVGRIDQKKNIGLLIRAFALLRNQFGFDGHLVFVGEEYRKSQVPDLHNLVASLNLLPYIRFVGAIPDLDLRAMYGAALVSVFCSLHEGFGIVALEAMACGTPLVVTPAGAVLEAVGNGAMVVPPDDANKLAETLSNIIRTPALYDKLRKYGIQQANKFSWKISARQTLSLYEMLTE